MRCGFCGTEVNDGYTVCPSCHAEYEKQANWFAGFILFVVIALAMYPVMSAARTYMFGPADPFSVLPVGMVTFLGTVILYVALARFLPGRWRWVRRQRV
jgi:hypothetical protein